MSFLLNVCVMSRHFAQDRMRSLASCALSVTCILQSVASQFVYTLAACYCCCDKHLLSDSSWFKSHV